MQIHKDGARRGWLTVDEAAEAAEVSSRTVERWISGTKPKVPSRLVGRRRYIRRRDLKPLIPPWRNAA